MVLVERTAKADRAGMTLLEVVIAIALLGVAVAFVGEMARNAFQNAKIARDMIQAELLAESVLAKIRLGIIDMVPAFDVPIGSGSYTNRTTDLIEDTHAMVAGHLSDVLWLYSVEIVSVKNYEDYLAEVAVTVFRNVSDGQRSVGHRLVRWVALEPEKEEEFY